MKYEDGEILRLWDGGHRRWLEVPRPCQTLSGPTGYKYYEIGTTINKRKIRTKVHRVVWTFFNVSIPEGYEINHIDGNKFNNRIENLELVTHLENMKHAKARGLMRTGEAHPRSKLKANDVRKIKYLLRCGDLSHKQIAIKFGVSRQTIGFISNNKIWDKVG